jgi:hypothetical protein
MLAAFSSRRSRCDAPEFGELWPGRLDAMRLEIAVKTSLGFYWSWSRENGDPLVDQAPISFEGRTFVWHSNENAARDDRLYPTLTTMVRDEADAVQAETDAARLLSALAFSHHVEMTPMVGIRSGPAAERSRSIFRQPGGRTVVVARAPTAVVVAPDDRLRLALALHREGLSAESPFFGFLAYWNALDVVLQDDARLRDEYLEREGARIGSRSGRETPPEGWAIYLRESSRNAVAHAVRDSGRSVIDPDLAPDRRRLAGDASMLGELVRFRILDEWPYPVAEHV